MRAFEPYTLYLNWSPAADHAPLYLARAELLNSHPALAFKIERGAGSYAAALRVAEDPHRLGIADLTSVMLAHDAGRSAVAVMSIFAHSPYGLYWARSSGIQSLTDFTGKRIGALPNDPMRVLWRIFSKINDHRFSQNSWVEVGPNAKAQALKDKSIDIATNPYLYYRDSFALALGADLMHLSWRDAGLDLYSNALIVHPRLLSEQTDVAATIVQTIQRAYQQCLAQPEPCIDALKGANPLTNRALELKNWTLLRELMVDKNATAECLGCFDLSRVQHDYEIVKDAFNLRTNLALFSLVNDQHLLRSIH